VTSFAEWSCIAVRSKRKADAEWPKAAGYEQCDNA
jgi:hypothetical protein